MLKDGEGSVIQELKKCYWYRSKSIENEYRVKCHVECDGFNSSCEKYLSRSCLENKLIEE